MTRSGGNPVAEWWRRSGELQRNGLTSHDAEAQSGRKRKRVCKRDREREKYGDN
ncbi:hypothetical protein BO83DRAFT_375635, partial [Aspergillus eucalypticola CBS 122712]